MATAPTGSQASAVPLSARTRALFEGLLTSLRSRQHPVVNHSRSSGSRATANGQGPIALTGAVLIVPMVVVTGPLPGSANEPSSGTNVQSASIVPIVLPLSCTSASAVVPTVSTSPLSTVGQVVGPPDTIPGVLDNGSAIASGQSLPLPVAGMRPTMLSVDTSNAMPPLLGYHGLALVSPSLAVDITQQSSVSHESDMSFDEIAHVQGLGI